MYIVVQDGMPSVVKSLDTGTRMTTLAVMAETWKYCYAFSAKVRYVGAPSRDVRFSWFKRALAHTIYNPWTDVINEWRESGEYTIPEILALVERGLEKDDDIIQQWFGADEVMKLLRSAKTFDELCDRVRCVCGEFETDERLKGVVESILGKQNY